MHRDVQHASAEEGTEKRKEKLSPRQLQKIAHRMQKIPRRAVRQVALGVSSSLMLTTDGCTYFWGIMGNSRRQHPSEVIQLKGLEVISVAVVYGLTVPPPSGTATLNLQDQDHFCCVTTQPHRNLWTWGNNDCGQCGRMGGKHLETPRPVMSDGREHVASVTCGFKFTVVCMGSNKIYSFGSNNLGQLGLGTMVHERNRMEETRTVFQSHSGNQKSPILLEQLEAGLIGGSHEEHGGSAFGKKCFQERIDETWAAVEANLGGGEDGKHFFRLERIVAAGLDHCAMWTNATEFSRNSSKLYRERMEDEMSMEIIETMITDRELELELLLPPKLGVDKNELLQAAAAEGESEAGGIDAVGSRALEQALKRPSRDEILKSLTNKTEIPPEVENDPVISNCVETLSELREILHSSRGKLRLLEHASSHTSRQVEDLAARISDRGSNINILQQFVEDVARIAYANKSKAWNKADSKRIMSKVWATSQDSSQIVHENRKIFALAEEEYDRLVHQAVLSRRQKIAQETVCMRLKDEILTLNKLAESRCKFLMGEGSHRTGGSGIFKTIHTLESALKTMDEAGISHLLRQQYSNIPDTDDRFTSSSNDRGDTSGAKDRPSPGGANITAYPKMTGHSSHGETHHPVNQNGVAADRSSMTAPRSLKSFERAFRENGRRVADVVRNLSDCVQVSRQRMETTHRREAHASQRTISDLLTLGESILDDTAHVEAEIRTLYRSLLSESCQ